MAPVGDVPRSPARAWCVDRPGGHREFHFRRDHRETLVSPFPQLVHTTPMTQNKTAKGARAHRVDESKALMYMGQLPKEFRAWLKEHAITNWSTASMYKTYRKYGRQRALLMLVAREAADTSVTYGPDHPEADPVYRAQAKGLHIDEQLGRFARQARDTMIEQIKASMETADAT
jgi:hypothetical protein